MAEPDRIDDLEFELTSENTDDNPEFSIEELDPLTSSVPEFSLEETGEIEGDAEEETNAFEQITSHSVNSQETSAGYSDDILSQPTEDKVRATPTEHVLDNVESEEEETANILLETDIELSHSPGTLHREQAHQLEMSLLERIDDLIQTLQKRARSGSSPEQLPHKQFATGLHYIKHENNHYLGAKWLRKAAMQGHAKAQLYLGMLFLQGNGVPKSLFHAYAWFSLAVCQNIAEAKDARKKLEKHLTAKEINSALKYAADLLDKIHLP